jgi:diguanylate cyclase (GGDEF)-like protein
MDLNGFKQINDRYGHAAGDLILVEFARRLTTAIRPADTAARLGGDEFVVLATAIEDEAEARALAQRLHALAEEPVVWNGETLRFGVSVGLAAWGRLDRPGADTLIAAADAAMYAEKTAQKHAAAPSPVPR